MTHNVSSLLTLTVHYAAINIENWRANDYEIVTRLPPAIKERILNIVTCSSLCCGTTEFPKVLDAVVHAGIRKLDLTHTDLSDALLASVSVCTNLQRAYFNGRGAVGLTCEGLISFITGKNQLTVLTVTDCQMVTDQVLKTISSYCPRLISLDVGCCTNITDEGLCALSALGNIKSLRISNTQVTHKGVLDFVEGPSGKILRELRINNCRYITEDVLHHIADNCPLLETLIFYNCAINRDDVALAFEGKYFKKLKQLTWTVTF